MNVAARLAARLADDDGATMVEYAFLLVGIALVVVVAAQVFGVSVRDAILLPVTRGWL